MKEDDIYGLLDGDNTCSKDEIRKKFQLQIKTWHPGKCASDQASTRSRWVNQAYKILSDIEARAFWDRRTARQLKEEERRLPRVVIQL
jgi:curved DNA-binding protein